MAKQYSYDSERERPGWPVETVFYRPTGERLFCIEVTKIAAQSIVDELNRLLVFKGDLIKRLVEEKRISNQVDLAMDWVEGSFAGRELDQVDNLLAEIGAQPELLAFRTQVAIFRTSSRAKANLPHWRLAVDRSYAYAQKMHYHETERLFRGLIAKEKSDDQ